MSSVTTSHQRIQKLVVIANRPTTLFFSLVGAVGFEISLDQLNDQDQLRQAMKPAIKYIRSNVRNIGAILIAPVLGEMLIERMERMRGVEIPIVQLPDGSGESQAERLESIMEKAVGMKLDLAAFSGTNKQ